MQSVPIKDLNASFLLKYVLAPNLLSLQTNPGKSKKISSFIVSAIFWGVLVTGLVGAITAYYRTYPILSGLNENDLIVLRRFIYLFLAALLVGLLFKQLFYPGKIEKAINQRKVIWYPVSNWVWVSLKYFRFLTSKTLFFFGIVLLLLELILTSSLSFSIVESLCWLFSIQAINLFLEQVLLKVRAGFFHFLFLMSIFASVMIPYKDWTLLSFLLAQSRIMIPAQEGGIIAIVIFIAILLTLTKILYDRSVIVYK